MKIHPATDSEYAWIEFDREDEAEIEAIAQRLLADRAQAPATEADAERAWEAWLKEHSARPENIWRMGRISYSSLEPAFLAGWQARGRASGETG